MAKVRTQSIEFHLALCVVERFSVSQSSGLGVAPTLPLAIRIQDADFQVLPSRICLRWQIVCGQCCSSVDTCSQEKCKGAEFYFAVDAGSPVLSLKAWGAHLPPASACPVY